MPGFAGTRLPSWLSRAVHDGLGGICVFGHNVASTDQLRALTDDAHGLGRVVVSIDEEGGIVSRLGAAGGSRHVGAAALGRVGDPGLTERVAASVAVDLREVGVDLDLAPVADVTSNPDNPVIGVRSFGTDPSAVGEHVAAFVRGLQSTGVAACAKHFPGHGDTSVDSHVGLPRIDVDLDTLRSRDLPPFAAAVEAGARAVMTAHIVFGALDDAPATVSAPVLSLLRDDLGFDGAIVSDAMDMRAVVQSIGLAEACVRAVAAGVDLVALGNPVLNTPEGDDEATFGAALDAVVRAVHDGVLDVARLREAAGRVDALERWCADRRHGEVPQPDQDVDDEAARRSLHTTGDVAGALSGTVEIVDIRRRRNIASGGNAALIAQALAQRLPGSRVVAGFAPGRAVEGRADGAVDPSTQLQAGRADVIITGTPTLDEVEQRALRQLLAASPGAVVVCTGLADDEVLRADRVVRTFGDSWPTARAVADLLT
ncbi:hypothetical protein VV01_10515 [Luteipulveratus halotolerans]|uniref:Glycoside hydrolase family 3 N-terminal domain-containing protein n=2 Tax=Luteipulveratus halotolerans TaxID=1631356 RepID=A0A0L6CNP2_9MICO|nr:hypothetical protein VV01_10515 [Luteipulveratus halotolerans]